MLLLWLGPFIQAGLCHGATKPSMWLFGGLQATVPSLRAPRTRSTAGGNALKTLCRASVSQMFITWLLL